MLRITKEQLFELYYVILLYYTTIYNIKENYTIASAGVTPLSYIK